jgi:hypothetical protein
MVLQNSVLFGSVNANRHHYGLAAEALAQADPGWLADLITRQVPLGQWAFKEGGIKRVRFRRAVRDWQDSERLRLASDVAKAGAAGAIWQAQREGILAKIKRAAGGSGAKGQDELRRALAELEGSRPEPVLVPSLFFEDATPEKLALALATGWPSASLSSDEAGLVIGSHAMSDQSVMRTMSLCNRLWDGQRFDRQRATTPDAVLRGRRFTVNLMAQPSAFSVLTGIGGGLARGLGFLDAHVLAVARQVVAFFDGDVVVRLRVRPSGLRRWRSRAHSRSINLVRTGRMHLCTRPPSAPCCVARSPR